jgi:putative transposase
VRLWRRKVLERVTLPPTVHHHAHFRLWQRRFYDMNIWTPKKRDGKLHYMHGNPLKRGLVKGPGDQPWSSSRFYFLSDASMLTMDRMP